MTSLEWAGSYRTTWRLLSSPPCWECSGVVLQLYGVLVLRRVVVGEGASDTIASFGAMALGVGIVISLIDRTALYTATHTLEYGIGAGTGPDQSQLLDLVSVILLKFHAGLSLMGFYAFLLGFYRTGCGSYDENPRRLS